jgi:hypothetical protein
MTQGKGQLMTTKEGKFMPHFFRKLAVRCSNRTVTPFEFAYPDLTIIILSIISPNFLLNK